MPPDEELGGTSLWDGSLLYGAATADPEPLTLAALERGMERIAEQHQTSIAEQAQRAAAWADLHLDWGAMDPVDQALCMHAYSGVPMHPKDAKRVEAIIERYSRGV
jgi:hypothetical protein